MANRYDALDDLEVGQGISYPNTTRNVLSQACIRANERGVKRFGTRKHDGLLYAVRLRDASDTPEPEKGTIVDFNVIDKVNERKVVDFDAVTKPNASASTEIVAVPIDYSKCKHSELTSALGALEAGEALTGWFNPASLMAVLSTLEGGPSTPTFTISKADGDGVRTVTRNS